MNVLLTGGSRGIGAATVRALHADGHNVFFTYNSSPEAAEQLAEELGNRVTIAQCDISDPAALAQLVDTCVDRFDCIDVLVNNAAIFEYNPFFENTYEGWQKGWQRTFAVNVFGSANLTYLVMQNMRQFGRGRVINVVSRSSHRGELSFADYGASKAALNNLTKSIARSTAKDGIISIAIAPGFIKTEMAAEELENRRHEIEAEIPARRVGTPEEVASIIAFFCSGAGDYANGSTIDVNGGSYVR